MYTTPAYRLSRMMLCLVVVGLLAVSYYAHRQANAQAVDGGCTSTEYLDRGGNPIDPSLPKTVHECAGPTSAPSCAIHVDGCCQRSPKYRHE
jgi:hypothetical protein